MRRATIFAVTVAALMVLGGCMGGGGQPNDSSNDGSGLSASEIRSQSISAMKDVKTAKYEMNIDASTSRGDVTMDITGAMDREAKKMQMDMSMEMGSRSIDAKAYIVGDKMYMNVRDRWLTRDISDRNTWQNGGQIASSRKMLEAVSVTKAGTATVAGTETYVLKLNAENMQKFREALSSQMSQTSQNAGSMAAGDVKSFDAKMYIDKETKQIRRVKINMEMNSNGQTVDLSMTITYTQIGGDVSINVPDEAKGLLRGPATGAPA